MYHRTTALPNYVTKSCTVVFTKKYGIFEEGCHTEHATYRHCELTRYARNNQPSCDHMLEVIFTTDQ